MTDESAESRRGRRFTGIHTAVAVAGILAVAAAGGWLLGTGLAAPRAGVAEAAAPVPSGGDVALESGESGRPSGAAAAVEMTDVLEFQPATVEIRVGETVRWKNAGQVPHTVTADPSKAGNPDLVGLPEGVEPFGSDLLGAGESFSHTFTVPGEYRYFCIPHQMAGMAGTVIVRS